MFYFPKDGFLITGDTVMETESGTTFRPTGNEKELAQSAKMLLERGFSDDLRCYCGHGRSTTFGVIKNVLAQAAGITKI